MSHSPSRILVILGISAALSLTGCKSNTAPPANAPTAANPDGTPAQQNSSSAPGPTNQPYAVQPNQANSIPPPQAVPPVQNQGLGSNQAPAQATEPSRQPLAPPSAPVRRTVPAGTAIRVRITESLAASKNNVGDGFSGVLESPVSAGNSVVFRSGDRVSGTVVAAKGRGRFKGAGALGIELTSIGETRISTNEYEQETKGKGKRTAGFIGGGAGGGALIGALAGGGKGALLGGLLGAGAGTAGAAFTGNKDVVIPSESIVTFRLSNSITR